MDWVKLHATPPYYLDGALLRAGEPAEVLFLRGLAYSGNSETAGLIDKAAVPMLCPTRTRARVEALVREGLWLDEGVHYRIRSWDRHQEEHDAAARKRQMDRDRMREKRAAERQGATASRDSRATRREPSPDVIRQSYVEGERDEDKSKGKDPSSAEPRDTAGPTLSLVIPEPPAVPTADPVDALFEAWWQLVPRRVERKTARAAYGRALRKVAGPQVLLDGIAAYAALVARERRDPSKVAHPTSWLNAERWNDELPAASADRFGVGFHDDTRQEPSRSMTGAEWAAEGRRSS